jgi:AraC-like DNA-binding protein
VREGGQDQSSCALDMSVGNAALRETNGSGVGVRQLVNARLRGAGECSESREPTRRSSTPATPAQRTSARARAEVTASDRPISVVAHRWGFSDTSYFSRTFKAHYGY